MGRLACIAVAITSIRLRLIDFVYHYLRLIDCVYHSTLGLRVITKKEGLYVDGEVGVHCRGDHVDPLLHLVLAHRLEKGNSNSHGVRLSTRQAGPSNHQDDKVDSDQ